jgi:hypothetical protein
LNHNDAVGVRGSNPLVPTRYFQGVTVKAVTLFCFLELNLPITLIKPEERPGMGKIKILDKTENYLVGGITLGYASNIESA